MVVSHKNSRRSSTMSTIPTSLTEKQFGEHVLPYLSVAKRGFVCRIPLYKVFNYIMYRLHTGCQWDQLPIDSDLNNSEKKRLAIMRFIIIFASGAAMAAYKKYGMAAS